MKTIFLIGYMGCGKSTLGKALARRCELDFIDLDDYIEARAGKKIREIFAEEGEEAFRDMERRMLREVSADGKRDVVVACGGGTHMTLVLAGFYGCSTQEAEIMKRDPAQEANVFPVVKPVVEKMASIVKRSLEEYPVDTVYVVGGACCFTQFEEVFEKYLGTPVVKPAAPLLVTPLGIAMNCTE